ncbi:TRAP transporter substrate-binding protein DctP [Marinovum sp. 2_MG-2023]|uniref:TRAP transporter substrate-binding protein DctP n=1 Tax=unclassified Marinovum TaxID=2647166 RepID=UPI0026E1606B|nr:MULTISPECIES: TRAP transporter substrate-binding protein DctP [unclassified Marinovum]MDO6731884.1 TRAP transporter substrate-binding protein DctP [Marinovum sp. 2_MG-2023]MDO6781136.1 TRAP transporter substrate-binding protein DctP [Marinovum sp. 1_MG-2023]
MSFTSRITMLTTTAALLASAAAADTRLRIAGTVPAEHFGNAVLEQMAKDIEDAGVGLDVKYFPAGQLGSGEELLESAIRGEVQMVHATVYAQKDARLEINSLPFMVTTKEELDAVYGDQNSEYNKILGEILTSFGIQPLGTIGEGLIGMIATQRPADPTKIGSQGMNVRAWSSQIAKQTMEELGYNVTTLNWAEVFPAVQAGTIDGAICCTPEWAYTTFAASGVGNTYVPYNAFIESTMIYANKKFYDGLTEEQRAVVDKETTEAAAEISKLAWERSQGFMDQLKEADWEIVEFSQEERDAIKAHIQATVWPNVADVVGQDILDRLTAN